MLEQISKKRNMNKNNQRSMGTQRKRKIQTSRRIRSGEDMDFSEFSDRILGKIITSENDWWRALAVAGEQKEARNPTI